MKGGAKRRDPILPVFEQRVTHHMAANGLVLRSRNGTVTNLGTRTWTFLICKMRKKESLPLIGYEPSPHEVTYERLVSSAHQYSSLEPVRNGDPSPCLIFLGRFCRTVVLIFLLIYVLSFFPAPTQQFVCGPYTDDVRLHMCLGERLWLDTGAPLSADGESVLQINDSDVQCWEVGCPSLEPPTAEEERRSLRRGHDNTLNNFA